MHQLLASGQTTDDMCICPILKHTNLHSTGLQYDISYTQFNGTYLDGNLFQADGMAAILMAPVWLPHVPLISVTNCAAFNVPWSSFNPHVCDTAHSYNMPSVIRKEKETNCIKYKRWLQH